MNKLLIILTVYLKYYIHYPINKKINIDKYYFKLKITL